MEFIYCESVDDYLSNQDLRESWVLILAPTLYLETRLTKYSPEIPVKSWVKPSGEQKWVIGTAIHNNVNGALTLTVHTNGVSTLAHETSVYTLLSDLEVPFVLGRSTSQARINSLDIMVNELEVRLKGMSEESVRVHDRLRDEQLRLLKSKEEVLDATRLITILRDRISSRDNDIISLKEDKLSLQKRVVELETSLEISNASLKELESTPATSSLLNISLPIP